MGNENMRNSARDDNMTLLYQMMRDFRAEMMGALKNHMEKEEEAYKDQASALNVLADRVDAVSGILKAFPTFPDGTANLGLHLNHHETIEEERARKKRDEDDANEVALEGKKALAGAVVKYSLEAAKWGLIAYIGLAGMG